MRLVNKDVRAELRRNILSIAEIDKKYFDDVYNIALRSIQAGRDLGSLTQALWQMKIKGITRKRAAPGYNLVRLVWLTSFNHRLSIFDKIRRTKPPMVNDSSLKRE